jgi:WD40 repeat protein
VSRRRVLSSRPGALERCWEADVDDYVAAVAWSPGGDRLAVAGAGGPVHVLDAGDGRSLRRMEAHGTGTLDLAWGPHGLASAGQDGTVRLWDEDGELSHTLPAGAQWAERVAWSSDGRLVASAAGRSLRVWDASGELRREVTSPETIHDLDWHRGGPEIATAVYGGVRIWRVDGPGSSRHLPWKGSCLRCAFSPDGSYVATGDQDASVHFWRTDTGTDLIAQGYGTKVRQLCWDSSSRLLATAGGAQVLVWDCSGKGPAGTRPAVLDIHRSTVAALAFAHRSAVLVSADGAGRIAVWDPDRPPRRARQTTIGAPVTAVAWSQDDRRFVAAGADGSVVLHRLDDTRTRR